MTTIKRTFYWVGFCRPQSTVFCASFSTMSRSCLQIFLQIFFGDFNLGSTWSSIPIFLIGFHLLQEVCFFTAIFLYFVGPTNTNCSFICICVDTVFSYGLWFSLSPLHTVNCFFLLLYLRPCNPKWQVTASPTCWLFLALPELFMSASVPFLFVNTTAQVNISFLFF